MMTKKGYIRAANIIRRRGSSQALEEAFVEFFINDNPKFDIERFVGACCRDKFAGW